MLRVLFLIVCLCTSLLASAVPPHSMSKPLNARLGTTAMTADILIQVVEDAKSCSMPKWVDNSNLVYSSIGDIQLINVETGVHTSLGQGMYPMPSPDGSQIAFLHENQLWVMGRDGSAKFALTNTTKGLLGGIGYNYDFAWAPDSTQIALVYQPQMIPISHYQDREEEKTIDLSTTSAIDIEDVVSHPIKSLILLIDAKTGCVKNEILFDAAIRDLSWIDGGQKLLFTKEVVDIKKFEDMVQILSLDTGEISTLIAFDCQQQYLAPLSSPDTKSVAIAYDADNRGNCMCSIGIIDAENTVQRLTYEMKMYRPQWSRDGFKIYALRSYGAYNQIYSIDVASGALHQLTDAPQTIQGFRLSPDGSKLMWLAEDAHGTKKIQLATSDGETVQDLIVVETAPQNIALSKVEEVEWEVFNYPTAMRGLLLLPINYQEGQRYPLVVDIHGGGPGASIYVTIPGILTASPLEWQLWTAKGYAVFVPEFRSSASFGPIAITRDYFQEHDIENQDINDINSGVDSLIARGIVDEKKVAVIGHSAGARRANLLTVTTHRYKAVVSHDGWADEWLDGGLWTSPLFPHPVLDPENYQKTSSLFLAKGATTPTLFLMGNPRLGGIDPHEGVKWLYYALKAQGVPTKYIYYPDEGHVYERSANKRHAVQMMLEWVDRYTNGTNVQ